MADKDTDNEIDESDNGSIHDESSSADDGTDDEQYDGDDDKECPEPNLPLPELPESVLCRRMPCVAHTLQLVVKQVYRKHYAQIIMKARKVVSQIRRSSVAVEKLNRRCGKSLVADCTTRWNSTYMMAQRLLVIKSEVNDVLAEMGIDTLLVSEWAKLGEMASLLEPFATQTDILQTDALSLSYVLPSILELECHLQNFQSANQLTKLMLDDLQSRFSSILNPLCHQFNPLPAAACLLDHTVAPVLFSRDMQHLLEAAKGYIFSQVLDQWEQEKESRPSTSSDPVDGRSIQPAMKRFKYLSQKIQSNDIVTTDPLTRSDSIQSQVAKYLDEIRSAAPTHYEDALTFWASRRPSYDLLAPLAEDLIAAPASQAYVERIFSLCGLLTAGHRNRMSKNLEMRVFVKLNKQLVD